LAAISGSTSPPFRVNNLVRRADWRDGVPVEKEFCGRADVRTALYMPTLTAIRINPVLRAFYQRLRAAGKTAKMALTACMRKLLVTLNAILRSQCPWQPQHA